MTVFILWGHLAKTSFGTKTGILRMSLIILINTVGAQNQVGLPAFDTCNPLMGVIEQNQNQIWKVGARGL